MGCGSSKDAPEDKDPFPVVENPPITGSAKYIARSYRNIKKPDNDPTEYRGLELTNRMRVMLMSNPKAEKAAAAMNVGVGYMMAPWELPGLAHLCEHVLCMGSYKYPNEYEFFGFLHDHAGDTNASIGDTDTTYAMEIDPAYLEPALEKFCQFFIHPLFNASSVEREIKSVDLENQGYVHMDEIRSFLVQQENLKPGHDYTKFDTGNKVTLLDIPFSKGIDVRDELEKFHRQFYSSNIMSLAVYGREPMQVLIDMVVPLFSAVLNKNAPMPIWLDHPLGSDQVRKEIHIVPIQDCKKMILKWPIPDQTSNYKTNPCEYITYMLNYKGPGSLNSLLKDLDLASDLEAAISGETSGFDFFEITMALIADRNTDIYDIVKIVFQFLNLLQKEQPKEWVFAECQKVNKIDFEVKSKESTCGYVMTIADSLRHYPFEDLISVLYCTPEFNPKKIHDILSLYLTAERMQIIVISPRFLGLTDRVEHWYKVEYSVQDIPVYKIKEWQKRDVNDKLYLREKNRYRHSQDSTTIVEREVNQWDIPRIIAENLLGRVWYKQDNKFLKAITYVSVNCFSLHICSTPLHSMLVCVYVLLVEDSFVEELSDASLANLGCDVKTQPYGIQFSVSGYSYRVEDILEIVIHKLTDFKPDEKRFFAIKEAFLRTLKNMERDEPPKQAKAVISSILSQKWTAADQLAVADQLTLMRLNDYIPLFLSRLYLEFLIYGNATRDEAVRIFHMVQNRFKEKCETKPFALSQIPRNREMQLPDGSYYVLRLTDQIHSASVVRIYLQCHFTDDRQNVILRLIHQIFSELFFDDLRTKQQLGYETDFHIREGCGVKGCVFLVYTDRQPEAVELRIEFFIQCMKSYLENMTFEEFQKHVEALAHEWEWEPQNMQQQYQEYWTQISTNVYNFHKFSNYIKQLKTLTKEDLINYYQEHLSLTSPRRRKFCVYIYGKACAAQGDQKPNLAPTDYDLDSLRQHVNCNFRRRISQESGKLELGRPTEITDTRTFVKGMTMYPYEQPYVEVSTFKQTNVPQ